MNWISWATLAASMLLFLAARHLAKRPPSETHLRLIRNFVVLCWANCGIATVNLLVLLWRLWR